MRIVVEWPDLALKPEVSLEGEWHPRQLSRVPFFINRKYREVMRDRVLAAKHQPQPQPEVQEEVKRNVRRRS